MILAHSTKMRNLVRDSKKEQCRHTWLRIRSFLILRVIQKQVMEVQSEVQKKEGLVIKDTFPILMELLTIWWSKSQHDSE